MKKSNVTVNSFGISDVIVDVTVGKLELFYSDKSVSNKAKEALLSLEKQIHFAVKMNASVEQFIENFADSIAIAKGYFDKWDNKGTGSKRSEIRDISIIKSIIDNPSEFPLALMKAGKNGTPNLQLYARCCALSGMVSKEQCLTIAGMTDNSKKLDNVRQAFENTAKDVLTFAVMVKQGVVAIENIAIENIAIEEDKGNE